MTDDFMLAPIKRKKVVREKTIEAGRKALVKQQGGMSFKWTSPGMVGLPDQIELYGTATMEAATGFTREACIALLATCIQFSEIKQQGKKPRPEQLRRHAELRALGFTVNIVDQL